MTTKHCTACGRRRRLDNFYISRRAKDGRTSQCKACIQAYNDAHAEDRRRLLQQWRKANPERYREMNVRHVHAYRQRKREGV